MDYWGDIKKGQGLVCSSFLSPVVCCEAGLPSIITKLEWKTWNLLFNIEKSHPFCSEILGYIFLNRFLHSFGLTLNILTEFSITATEP